MRQRIPIYTCQDDTYVADSCRPLLAATKAGEIRLEALVHGHYPGRRLPKKALPGLKTVGFWDAVEQQKWRLDWHQNEGIELTLLERGHLEFAVEADAFQLQPNDLTITRPWQRHRLGDTTIGPGRLHWIIIDLGVRRPHQTWEWPEWIMLTQDDLEELTLMLRQNEQPVWQNATEVSRCFLRIARVVEQRCEEEADVSWLIVLINELLLSLLDLLRSRDVVIDASLSETQRTVELFLEDLRYNRPLLSQEWTLARMAEACGLGVTRFTDYCRRISNSTPIQYLNRMRLEAAAQFLIEYPQYHNADIAEKCGFSSPQYFATVFRRHFGCTPQQYRSENVTKPRQT